MNGSFFELHSAKWLVLIPALIISACLLLDDSALAEEPGAELYGSFDGDPMYTLLPPDAIPAIRQPEFVTGGGASAQMSPQEPVIGLVIDGEARAYSLWQLDAHEIVNDRIQGSAVAVTW